MKRSTSTGLGAAAAALAMLPTGCGALQQFEEGGATVFVFATHHATPEDGAFPPRGEDSLPRTFQTDNGWDVTLLEAYVTIASVTLVACNGSERDLNMFWGPCPEDIKDQDLATLTVAGNRINDGDYCGLRVTYAAYETPVIDPSADETRHETPTNEAVSGSTIYLRGGVDPGDGGEFAQFEVTSSATIVVELDLSEIEGEGTPFRIAHREDFPKELLVSKTYDRFFDGIDFSDSANEQISDSNDALIESQLASILEQQTRISLGTVVTLDDDDEPPMDGG